MPVVADTLAVQLLLDLGVHGMGFFEKFLPGAHACPLEGRKGLRHKEGGADRDLAFSVSLFLWDLIIAAGDFFRQVGDSLLVLFRLRGQAQHEIQLDLAPAALEGLSGPLQDHLLRQALVDHVPQTLGTGLRREGQAAFAHVLHLSHDIQGKRVDAQRRKGDIYPLISEGIDEEIHQLRKL